MKLRGAKYTCNWCSSDGNEIRIKIKRKKTTKTSISQEILHLFRLCFFYYYRLQRKFFADFFLNHVACVWSMFLAELNQSQVGSDAGNKWPLMSSAKNKPWYHFIFHVTVDHWVNWTHICLLSNFGQLYSATKQWWWNWVADSGFDILHQSMDDALKFFNEYSTFISLRDYMRVIGHWLLKIDFNSKCSLYFHFYTLFWILIEQLIYK